MCVAPRACVHPRKHLGMLLMRRRMSWDISCQTWIRASLSSWTFSWCSDITSQRFSIGFRCGEREGQLMASTPLSSRNCLHNQAKLGQVLSCCSCTRRSTGPTAPVYSLTVALRIISQDLTAVRVLLASK